MPHPKPPSHQSSCDGYTGPSSECLFPVPRDHTVRQQLKVLGLVPPGIGDAGDLITYERTNLFPSESVLELDDEQPLGRCDFHDGLVAGTGVNQLLLTATLTAAPSGLRPGDLLLHVLLQELPICFRRLVRAALAPEDAADEPRDFEKRPRERLEAPHQPEREPVFGPLEGHKCTVDGTVPGLGLPVREDKSGLGICFN